MRRSGRSSESLAAKRSTSSAARPEPPVARNAAARRTCSTRPSPVTNDGDGDAEPLPVVFENPGQEITADIGAMRLPL